MVTQFQKRTVTKIVSPNQITSDVTIEEQIKPHVQGKICTTVRSAFFLRGGVAYTKKG